MGLRNKVILKNIIKFLAVVLICLCILSVYTGNDSYFPSNNINDGLDRVDYFISSYSPDIAYNSGQDILRRRTNIRLIKIANSLIQALAILSVIMNIFQGRSSKDYILNTASQFFYKLNFLLIPRYHGGRYKAVHNFI